jgi:hypothetical protein
MRQQWQLSLREVEQRSLRLAKERNNPSYQVSAGWLNRLEREQHELTVSKLVALSEIYNVPTEHLLRPINPGEEQALNFNPFPQVPDATTLLSPDDGALLSPYRRGIIGRRDFTMAPMIPTGSIVSIDTRERAVSSRRNWAHEFQRPIYFLMTRDGYVCGWCELDGASEWLTVIPHPLSPASSRRWKYRTEIETLGQVIVAAIRLTP